MNFKVKIALSLAGFSEADIATIEAALPAMDRILAMSDEARPLFVKFYPDLVSVIPAAKVLVAYAQKES